MTPGASRRTVLQAGALGVAAAVLPDLAGLARASAAPAVVRTVATGLDIPWGLDFLPDGSALFTQRDRATLSRVTADGTVTTIGTKIPGVVPRGEAGLLGLAVSPTYAQDRRVYLYASTQKDNRVGWLTFDAARNTRSTFTPVLTGMPVSTNHNGGRLAWTPSRNGLFVCVGDALDADAAQDVRRLNGKVLRVHRDGSASSSNPFYGARVGDDRVYTYGHRNPQGIAVADDGNVWEAELGLNTWDELNQLVVGRNYGWPRAEGTDGPGGYTDPLAQWNPDDCSPSGLAITGTTAWIGALRGQSLWSVGLSGVQRGVKTRYFQGTYGRMRTVKVAPNGNLWVTTSNGGGQDKILEIAPGGLA